MTALAHAHYFVLLAYTLLYAGAWLAPLFRTAWASRPHESLDRLRLLLGKEKAAVEAELRHPAARPPVPAAVPAGEPEGASRGASEGAPAGPAVPAGGDGVAGTPEEAGPDGHASWRRRTTERLHALPPLVVARYESPLVQEAVDQIRVQYPAGPYQQVHLERIPSFTAYTERVSAARAMAGLFVLIGLGLTMVRLNGVVDRIGAAADLAGMTSEGFLDEMGVIMLGIGGAFDSSIWGLGLMLAALLVVAFVDRRMQRRFAAVEQALSAEVVPALAELHARLMPDLTLGDLLAETGQHLQTLNRTVDGLTDGMARSLAGLGDRIETVLRDFGTFQDQYVRLNDLLKYIREASENLSKTTKALEGASKRLADPLDEYNRNLLAHLETVADAVAVNREGYALTAEEIKVIKAHMDAILVGVRNEVGTRLGESAGLQEAALGAVMDQAERTNKQLVVVSGSLEKASNVQIERTLATLTHAVERLGRRYDESQVPPSFFAWLVLLGRRARRDGLRSLFARRA